MTLSLAQLLVNVDVFSVRDRPSLFRTHRFTWLEVEVPCRFYELVGLSLEVHALRILAGVSNPMLRRRKRTCFFWKWGHVGLVGETFFVLCLRIVRGWSNFVAVTFGLVFIILILHLLLFGYVFLTIHEQVVLYTRVCWRLRAKLTILLLLKLCYLLLFYRILSLNSWHRTIRMGLRMCKTSGFKVISASFCRSIIQRWKLFTLNMHMLIHFHSSVDIRRFKVVNW
jgi:hypothetical protein